MAFIVAVGGLSGWKLDRTLLFVAAGFGIIGTSDGDYVYRNTIGTYHPGSVFDMGWPVAIVLLALAAWQPRARVRGITLDSSASGCRSWCLRRSRCFFALGIYLILTGLRWATSVCLRYNLATTSLLAVILRLTITFREKPSECSAPSQWAALTDYAHPPGRPQRLSLDLEQALGSAAEDPKYPGYSSLTASETLL